MANCTRKIHLSKNGQYLKIYSLEKFLIKAKEGSALGNAEHFSDSLISFFIFAYRLIGTDERDSLDVGMFADEVHSCMLAVYYI